MVLGCALRDSRKGRVRVSGWRVGENSNLIVKEVTVTCFCFAERSIRVALSVDYTADPDSLSALNKSMS